MRKLLCILLLLCLPLQSFALQIAGVQNFAGKEPSHALAHSEEQQHHHEVDGSIHFDESEESAEHIADDSPTPQQLLLIMSISPFSPHQMSLASKPAAASRIPHPYLDGPQRPPAFAPGLAAGG